MIYKESHNLPNVSEVKISMFHVKVLGMAYEALCQAAYKLLVL